MKTFLFLALLTFSLTFSDALKPEVSARLRQAFIEFTRLGRDRPPLGTVENTESTGDDSKTCDLCANALKILVPIVDNEEVYPLVVDFAKALCIREKWFTNRVCTGAVDMFKEELFAILPVMKDSPHFTCSKFLKLQCGDDDDPLNKWWNVTIPPEDVVPTENIQPSREQASTVQILHLSDMHMDPEYVAGSEANCTEPLCCRADSPSPTNPAYSRKAGKIGDYNCDTAPETMQAFLSSIAKQHPNISAVYITGDYVPHDVWNQTRQRHKSTINMVVDMLNKTFGKTPVYMAVGNHEGIPVNAFPSPANSLPTTQNMSWLYDDILYMNWVTKTRWLPSSTMQEISRTGSYSTLMKPGWRVISLNNNFCNPDNWWLYRNSTDPQNELQWLVSVLTAAEKANEKAHIMMHIPTGGGCLKVWSWNFYNIMYRFRKTIAAQFSGHTHDSYYTVYYDNVNFTTPTGINYVGPSITTYTTENPAYQLLTADSTTMEVLDYQIYYVDLKMSNAQGSLALKPLYSAKSAFNMTDLTPQSWHNLALRMEKDDTLFQRFHSWLNRLAGSGPCDSSCKRSVLCELVTSRSSDSTMCSRFFPSFQ